MSDTNGRVLAESLRARHPHPKVLYTSGYTDDVIVNHGVLETDTRFLHKSVTPKKLAEKARTVLDAEKVPVD